MTEAQRRVEPAREESPERFLRLFSQVSGMTLSQNLPNGGINKPQEAVLARVIGALVVGSCTNPSGHPKDLDIYVVTEDGRVTPRLEEYTRGLRDSFDLEYLRLTGVSSLGRLDILFEPLNRWLSGLSFLQRDALCGTRNPLIFAFDREDAEAIEASLKRVRRFG